MESQGKMDRLGHLVLKALQDLTAQMESQGKMDRLGHLVLKAPKDLKAQMADQDKSDLLEPKAKLDRLGHLVVAAPRDSLGRWVKLVLLAQEGHSVFQVHRVLGAFGDNQDETDQLEPEAQLDPLAQ
jgi:hypothetical protein